MIENVRNKYFIIRAAHKSMEFRFRFSNNTTLSELDSNETQARTQFPVENILHMVKSES